MAGDAPVDAAAAFVERGWAVVKGRLGAAAVERLRAAWDALPTAEAAPAQQIARPGVWQLPGVARAPGPLHEVFFSGLVPRLVRDCLTAWNEHRSARATPVTPRLLQDLALWKVAGAQGRVGWHDDYAYSRYLTPACGASVRIALDEESEASGCVWVASGSHRWGADLRLADVNWFSDPEALQRDRPALMARVRAAAIPVALQPGDISIHHCLTLHASGPNRSPHPRRTLVAHVFDGGCRFDPGGLPPGADPAHVPRHRDGTLSLAMFPPLGG